MKTIIDSREPMCRRNIFARTIQSLAEDKGWTPWFPLMYCAKIPEIHTIGGLYRIRVHNSHPHTYLGSSDRLLLHPCEDLQRALKQTTLPGHVPHTAGAYHWWLQTSHQFTFDVSLAPLPELHPHERKMLKSAALAIYRQSHAGSPIANYSRLPQEIKNQMAYSLPSFASHKFVPGTRPLGPLYQFGSLHSRRWGHHIWTPWLPLLQNTKTPPPFPRSERGLFRIRYQDSDSLIALGYGTLSEELQPWKYQKQNLPLECSWVDLSLPNHICRERLDDLIGGYLLSNLMPTPTPSVSNHIMIPHPSQGQFAA